MSDDSIEVAVRVKPFIAREESDRKYWIVKNNDIYQIDEDGEIISEPYTFGHIFSEESNNEEIFERVVNPLVASFLEGFNSTIFTYGQTSSGKTYTMLGSDQQPGLIQLTARTMFEKIEEQRDRKFLIRVSYIEIYNEKIYDLLHVDDKDLKLIEDRDGNNFILAKEEVVSNTSQMFDIIREGTKNRKTCCTNVNERTSESHTIFKIVVESTKNAGKMHTISHLYLVDLAGSKSLTTADRVKLTEGVDIDKSLLNLNLIITELSKEEKFVSFYDSKLTRLLQHVLDGNSKTLVIATISLGYVEETECTLAFAQRAKMVKTTPVINEIITDKYKMKLYRRLSDKYKEQLEEEFQKNNKLEEEKLNCAIIMDELQSKLNAIECFKSLKVQHITNRRYTIGPSQITPLEIIKEDEDENPQNLQNSLPLTPKKKQNLEICPETPPSELRKRIQLLEESYSLLKDFTQEESLVAEPDKVKELNERIENITKDYFNMQILYSETTKANKQLQEEVNLLSTDNRTIELQMKNLQESETHLKSKLEKIEMNQQSHIEQLEEKHMQQIMESNERIEKLSEELQSTKTLLAKYERDLVTSQAKNERFEIQSISDMVKESSVFQGETFDFEDLMQQLFLLKDILLGTEGKEIVSSEFVLIQQLEEEKSKLVEELSYMKLETERLNKIVNDNKADQEIELSKLKLENEKHLQESKRNSAEELKQKKKLLDEVTSLLTETGKLQLQIEILDKENKRLSDILKENEENLLDTNNIQEENKRLLEKVNGLEQMNKQYSSKIHNFIHEVIDLSEKSEELKHQLVNYKKLLEKYQADIYNEKNFKNQLENNIANIERERNRNLAIESEAKELRTKLDISIKKNEQLNENLEKQQKEKEQLNNIIEEQKLELSKKVIDLNKMLETANGEIKQLKENLDYLNEEIESKNKENVHLNTIISDFKSERKKLQKTIKKVKIAEKQINSDLKVHDDTITIMKNNFLSERNVLEKQLLQSINDVNRLEDTISEMRNNHQSELHEMKHNYDKSLKQLYNKIEEQEKKLKQNQKENGEVRSISRKCLSSVKGILSESGNIADLSPQELRKIRRQSLQDKSRSIETAICSDNSDVEKDNELENLRLKFSKLEFKYSIKESELREMRNRYKVIQDKYMKVLETVNGEEINKFKPEPCIGCELYEENQEIADMQGKFINLDEWILLKKFEIRKLTGVEGYTSVNGGTMNYIDEYFKKENQETADVQEKFKTLDESIHLKNLENKKEVKAYTTVNECMKCKDYKGTVKSLELKIKKYQYNIIKLQKDIQSLNNNV